MGQKQESLIEQMKAMGWTNPNDKSQSHGLTVLEMKQIQEKQTNCGTDDIRNALDKIPANVNPSIQINAVEKHLVHVVLLKDNWVTEKGKTPVNKGVSRMQKFYPNDFEKLSRTVVEKGKPMPDNAFAEYDHVTIVHHPNYKGKVKIETIDQSEALEHMSIDELRTVYFERSGNEDTDATISELITLIKAL